MRNVPSQVVIATVKPMPQHRDEVRAALLEGIPSVHDEPGCELYALMETSDALIFIEQWASEEALDHHGSGPTVAAMQTALEGRLSEPVSVVVGTPLAGDAPKGVLRG